MPTQHRRFSLNHQHPFGVRRRAALAMAMLGGAGVLLAANGCGLANQFKDKVHLTSTQSIQHIAGSALSVETGNGSVSVEAADRADVGIEVDLYGHDQARLQLAIVHAQRTDDGSLSIWVEWPGERRNGEGASIEIDIPEVDGLDVASSNGAITISGLSGHAELQTSNGSINIQQHKGSAWAKTSNGSINASQVSGGLDLRSSNGKAVISDAGGKVRVQTSNGPIKVSMADANTSPVDLNTSNGGITIEVGDRFQGVLKCNTSNAKIKLEIEGQPELGKSAKGSMRLEFEGSDQLSTVKTSNGSVRVVKRAPSHP
tara:strand:+ start:107093 stop:108037 length:945 start_codon:yes stop_codon:yes gene_type:complete